MASFVPSRFPFTRSPPYSSLWQRKAASWGAQPIQRQTADGMRFTRQIPTVWPEPHDPRCYCNPPVQLLATRLRHVFFLLPVWEFFFIHHGHLQIHDYELASYVLSILPSLAFIPVVYCIFFCLLIIIHTALCTRPAVDHLMQSQE